MRDTIRATLIGSLPGAVLVWMMLSVGLTVMLLSRLAILHEILPTGPRPLVAFDVSIHVVWPLIAGLGLIAWAFGFDMQTSWPAMIGYNLVIVMSSVLAVQGLGVTEFTMRRFRLGILLRVLAYGLLLLLLPQAFVPLLAVLGAADLWVNFRKLPRGDEPPETGAEDNLDAGVE
jgi:hypothetical protein